MRMTSAPSWARWSPQVGPAMNAAASTTRRPERISGMVGRRHKCREQAAEKLAVVAAREGGNEENLPRPLVRGKPCRGMRVNAGRVDQASLAPHHEGGDDADVGAYAAFRNRHLGDAGAILEDRFDLERRHAV